MMQNGRIKYLRKRGSTSTQQVDRNDSASTTITPPIVCYLASIYGIKFITNRITLKARCHDIDKVNSSNMIIAHHFTLNGNNRIRASLPLLSRGEDTARLNPLQKHIFQ